MRRGILPTYEFQCERCQHIDEKFFAVDNKPIRTTCTACGILQLTSLPIISRVQIGHIDKGRLQSVAFGREFKNEKDMMNYAKHVGAEPIGNEKVETIEKVSNRRNEEIEEKKYKDIAEGIEWSSL